MNVKNLIFVSCLMVLSFSGCQNEERVYSDKNIESIENYDDIIYPEENYYTEILHKLEKKKAPEILEKDGRKFALASHLKDEKRLKFEIAEPNTYNSESECIKISIINDTKYEFDFSPYFDGFEVFIDDSWRSVPYKYPSAEEDVSYILPAKKEETVIFDLSSYKIREGLIHVKTGRGII